MSTATPSTPRPRGRQRSERASSDSWTSLVAATSLGLSAVKRLRAQVTAEVGAAPEGEHLRLIVQSYPKESVRREGVPEKGAKPLASTQRAVTPDELRAGVSVNMLQLGAAPRGGASVVVAWVEHGAPDLEYDARRARPTVANLRGIARGGRRDAQLVLRRAA